jgi:hypothetical protein
MGLEDLEGCERFFSKSNALAPALRYASAFHRQQKIVEYIKHNDDFEVFANLSKCSESSPSASCFLINAGEFLVGNCKQALNLLKGKSALRRTMKEQGIESEATFASWLDEERTYLLSLSREPIQETLQMEYYQRLVNLQASEGALAAAQSVFHEFVPTYLQHPLSQRRRHASKVPRQSDATPSRTKAETCCVQQLEEKLEIKTRWTPLDADWRAASDLVGKRCYQRCLDTLEGLIVSRMFELTKMNMSHTGKCLNLCQRRDCLTMHLRIDISFASILRRPSRHGQQAYAPHSSDTMPLPIQ